MILSSGGIVQIKWSINFVAQWEQRADYCDDKKTRTETISCTIENGVGSKTRTYTTPCENHVYGTETYSDSPTCTVSSCNAGYQKSGNSCIQASNYCDDKKTRTETISCTIANGVGSKTRTYTTPCENHVYGTETYSDSLTCTVSSCNAGYQKSGNSCVQASNYCDDKKTRTETIPCTIANGVGSKTRTYTTPCENHVYGTETHSDGSCSYTCNTNYTRNGSSCVGKTLSCGGSAPSSNVDKGSPDYTYAGSEKSRTRITSGTPGACEYKCVFRVTPSCPAGTEVDRDYDNCTQGCKGTPTPTCSSYSGATSCIGGTLSTNTSTCTKTCSCPSGYTSYSMGKNYGCYKCPSGASFNGATTSTYNCAKSGKQVCSADRGSECTSGGSGGSTSSSNCTTYKWKYLRTETTCGVKPGYTEVTSSPAGTNCSAGNSARMVILSTQNQCNGVGTVGYTYNIFVCSCS